MKQMKATDLMVGDLVSYNGTPIKVENIHGDCINYSPDIPYVQEEFFIDIADVKPISLTPEILRKNGFQVDGYAILNFQDGKWIEYYFHEHRFSMYYEGIVHRSQPFYMHELQHSLRLCGLNDLADNFKLEE